MESRVKDPINATDYTLVSLKVSSERMVTSSQSIELKGVTVEVNIFEHMEKPYLTGSAIILDNADLYRTIGFMGAEKLEISIATDNDPDTTIIKKFYITKIANSIQANSNNKILVLDFIEDLAYHSRMKRISKSYEGTPDKIIKRILTEHLQRTFLDISIGFHSDGPMRVIIPNMTPLQAASWIKERAITSNGLPFYLFSTLCDDKIRFLDLEKVLDALPLNNEAMDYTYSDAYGTNLSKFNKFTQSYIIQNVRSSSKVNQLQFAQEGLLSASYDFYDPTVGFRHETKHNIQELYEELLDKNIIKKDQSEGIIDNTTLINDQLSHEYDTKMISQIAPNNLFADGMFNYYQSNDYTMKAKKKSLSRLLHKESIDITVPGRNFLNSSKNITVGNNINLKFLNSIEQTNRQDTTTEDEYIDIRKSGTYMIYATRHIFSGNLYNTVLSCTKLTDRTGL